MYCSNLVVINLTLPAFSETTIRNLLLKELEKRGVKTATEIQYRTPIGLMKPDALLQNGADYIIETKLGPQPKLLDAITQLYDYTKHIEVEGGFAILLPQELRRPLPIEWLEHAAKDSKTKFTTTAIFSDRRPSQSFQGSLTEVSDWISKHVLKPPEYVAADTSLAINVLTDAVEYINISTLNMGEDDLEDIFGGKTVFENILQYEEGKYPLDEMRKAAIYLLINQILFYHVLSSNDPITFPKIEEDHITSPKNISTYFTRVLLIDYTPTFGFDVASRLPDSAVDPLKKVIKAIKGIAPEKIKFDLLGKVFHDLIPFNIRKAVAAFYTNNEAAELLAQLAVNNPNDTVLDLACGSGTLLVSAYHQKKILLEKSGNTFDSNDHRRFLENDITGIDIMPFAAHLAVVHLSMQAPIYETEKVRVAVWDSTELTPNQNIPAIHRELKEAYKRPSLDLFLKGKPSLEQAYITKGALTPEGIGGEEIPLKEVDIVIMNPPFTRQERLPKEYKKSLDSRLRKYKKWLTGPLGLYGYFIFLADSFLKTSGKLALVLPATVLRIASTEGIRKLLVTGYNIEYIITTYQRAAFSEAAKFREILLLANKKMKSVDVNSSNNDERCLLVFLLRLPTTYVDSQNISEVIKYQKDLLDIGDTFENDFIKCKLVTNSLLKKSVSNLFKFIATSNWEIEDIWEKIKVKGL